MKSFLVVLAACIPIPGMASSLAAQDKKGQKLALLVGVRDYDHPEMRPLRYSENDVVELGKLLKEAGYDVTLLADGVGEKTAALSPSRANIEKHLAEILAKCKRREDAILIAFAGHGIQPEGDKDAYFCPKDANPKVDPKKSMVSLNKLYTALEESFAGVKVVLVDACRDDPKLARGRTGITGDSAPRPPRGVAVLFSCAAGEIAYEHEKYKHGVFFHHVLEGLRGKAKDAEDEITFTSLASYVARAVARDVPKLIGDGAQQSPNLKADLAGAPPVLAYLKRTETSPPEKPKDKGTVVKMPPDPKRTPPAPLVSASGDSIFTVDGAEVLRLDPVFKKPLSSFKAPGEIWHIAESRDAKWLAFTTQSEILVLDASIFFVRFKGKLEAPPLELRFEKVPGVAADCAVVRLANGRRVIIDVDRRMEIPDPMK